tara:strand:+ start:1158 stop:1325 length:168 start_codon:yes stop_codon:yes gene_type:complete
MPKLNIFNGTLKHPIPSLTPIPQFRPLQLIEKNKNVKSTDVFGKGVKNSKIKRTY